MPISIFRPSAAARPTAADEDGELLVHKTVFLRVNRSMLQHGWHPSEKTGYIDFMYRDIRYDFQAKKAAAF
jgi:hypothetical protein